MVGVIGNGSWATALVKILADNRHQLNWWIRDSSSIEYIRKRRHNPNYLHSAYFDVSLLNLENDVQAVVNDSDILVLAVPSAYIKGVLDTLDKKSIKDK